MLNFVHDKRQIVIRRMTIWRLQKISIYSKIACFESSRVLNYSWCTSSVFKVWKKLNWLHFRKPLLIAKIQLQVPLISIWPIFCAIITIPAVRLGRKDTGLSLLYCQKRAGLTALCKGSIVRKGLNILRLKLQPLIWFLVKQLARSRWLNTATIYKIIKNIKLLHIHPEGWLESRDQPIVDISRNQKIWYC